MPYLGEIRVFGTKSVPANWTPCSGQLLQINTNQALYSLLSTTYGGDGRINFALPDLRGRALVAVGTTPTTGTIYKVGAKGGTETVQLTTNTVPSHKHAVYVDNNPGDTSLDLLNKGYLSAKPQIPSLANENVSMFVTPALSLGSTIALSSNTVQSAGADLAHENRMPFMALIYCIYTLYDNNYPSHQ